MYRDDLFFASSSCWEQRRTISTAARAGNFAASSGHTPIRDDSNIPMTAKSLPSLLANLTIPTLNGRNRDDRPTTSKLDEVSPREVAHLCAAEVSFGREMRSKVTVSGQCRESLFPVHGVESRIATCQEAA